MTDQPSWADLFERADSYDVTTDGIRRELTSQRESDE
mgnify:CR=1 FL=1